jgi:hypothetical protein
MPMQWHASAMSAQVLKGRIGDSVQAKGCSTAGATSPAGAGDVAPALLALAIADAPGPEKDGQNLLDPVAYPGSLIIGWVGRQTEVRENRTRSRHCKRLRNWNNHCLVASNVS